ncbi:MAG: vWA domain-containing protein [Planctomycetota bacterium]|jgi:Ca-activated chloride channel family protein
MLEFDYSWLFFLLPVPLVVWWLALPYKEQREAIRTPFFDQLAELTGKPPASGAAILRRSWIQMLLLPLCWVLLVAALARPQWVEDPITKTESARDLMIAVDLSGSMEAMDFNDSSGEPTDRLSAVKTVLDDFMTRRTGDRLGLIYFGTAAFLQVPFTQDHDTCRTLLEEAKVRMAGPQTMLGDAIGLAIKLFEKSQTVNRVLILMTDGNDTGSKIPPIKAAEIASQHDVTVYCVAIGDPETTGEQKLEETTLQEIASQTGGRFYRAMDREQLDQIYQDLEQLEPQEFETLSYRPKRALFHWPLGSAIILILGYHSLLAIASRWQRGGNQDG